MSCFIKKIDVLLKIDALPSLTRLRKECDRVVGKTERLSKIGEVQHASSERGFWEESFEVVCGVWRNRHTCPMAVSKMRRISIFLA
jgi:hypothetical protein